jgi:hypothetical protein
MTQATTKTKTTARKPATKKVVVKPDLNSCFMFEILDLVKSQRTKPKKIEVLQEYQNPALTALLIWQYDPSIRSALPEGAVPYAALDELVVGNDTLSETIEKKKTDRLEERISSNAHTTIRNEYTKFYNFLIGGNAELSNVRRETIFINLVQALHPLEAEILILVKDKKLTDKYPIPFEIVQEAYPYIKWGNRV